MVLFEKHTNKIPYEIAQGPCMTLHVYYPGTQETETGGSPPSLGIAWANVERHWVTRLYFSKLRCWLLSLC